MPTPSQAIVAPVSASVELSAFSNPIDEWAQVVSAAVDNIGALGARLAVDPAPVLTQIIANQTGYGNQIATIATNMLHNAQSIASTIPDNLQKASGELTDGQFAAAVTTVYSIVAGGAAGVMFPLLSLTIPRDMSQNFANVVKTFTGIGTNIGFGALAALASVVYTFGDTGQDFVDAVAAQDPVTALSVVANSPAKLTGALLNGYKANPGLLSKKGLVGQLLSARDTIAKALGAAPNSATGVAASSVKPVERTVSARIGSADADAGPTEKNAATRDSTTAVAVSRHPAKPAKKVTAGLSKIGKKVSGGVEHRVKTKAKHETRSGSRK